MDWHDWYWNFSKVPIGEVSKACVFGFFLGAGQELVSSFGNEEVLKLILAHYTV